MKFVDNFTPEAYNHGVFLDDVYVDSYLSSVKLMGNTENKIEQIITQRYVAGFLQGVDYNCLVW